MSLFHSTLGTLLLKANIGLACTPPPKSPSPPINPNTTSTNTYNSNSHLQPLHQKPLQPTQLPSWPHKKLQSHLNTSTSNLLLMTPSDHYWILSIDLQNDDPFKKIPKIICHLAHTNTQPGHIIKPAIGQEKNQTYLSYHTQFQVLNCQNLFNSSLTLNNLQVLSQTMNLHVTWFTHLLSHHQTTLTFEFVS
ncbi:hypothetical protein CROQUDRAFT_722476 [Cronartium quercuum f. sp. fusiforme G11]|uniref:Uncharacterized protein n=1 Tax=Cronartium quercuum f. sp. fusiforme G11 TaxID=708437 RepID=A0A9P6NN16_9BASI|nr:hypothetical protein CROQUDRAFT_722476 [Cronartium quercuum f. sp. fusiforme G11]